MKKMLLTFMMACSLGATAFAFAEGCNCNGSTGKCLCNGECPCLEKCACPECHAPAPAAKE